MAQKIVSLDIREDLVCGVMLSPAGASATVIGCAVSVLGENSSLSESVAEVLHHVGYSDEPCRVALAAENFFYRNLSFPFHDKRKVDKILAIELEESVIVDMDEVLVDALVTGKKGGRSTVVAAMIDRELFGGLLAELAQLNLDPEIVTITNVQTALQLARQQEHAQFVLLDVGCKRATIYVMTNGRMRLIRTFVFEDSSLADFSVDKNSQQIFTRRPEKVEETFANLCRQVRHTLFTLDDVDHQMVVFLTGALADVPGARGYVANNLGCEVRGCDLVHPPVQIGPQCGVWRGDLMSSALALGIRSGRKQIGFNFRKKEFSKRVSLQRYRKLIPRIGVPLAAMVIGATIYLWNDFNQRHSELQSLRKQGETIFLETLPQVTRIVEPVQQLQVEIREIKKGTLGDAALESDLKILDLLAEVSVRIPESINVHVLRMVADSNGVLLRGLTDNFNSVDGLKKVLEKSAYFSSVTINSANLASQSSGIRFELKLELNRG